VSHNATFLDALCIIIGLNNYGVVETEGDMLKCNPKAIDLDPFGTCNIEIMS
jgi:hypothetical protein